MKICVNSVIPPMGLGIALTLGTAFGAEAAVIPAYTIGNVLANPGGNNVSTAMRFEVTIPLTLRSIGVYVRGADGPSIAGGNGGRKVTLWDDNGGVVLTTNISDSTPGSTLDANGDFRYVNVPSFTLPAGIYRLGSFIDAVLPAGDNALFTALNVTFANEASVTPTIVPINFNAPPNNRTNNFTAIGDNFPFNQVTASYRISANILFDDPAGTATTPEPSLIGGLLLCGLGGLLLKRKGD